MFDQIPNRRMTQRRDSFKSALISIWSVLFGSVEVWRTGRIGWETLGWTVVFVLSVHTYWKARHEDPWNPPDEDGMERHYGALDKTGRSIRAS